MLDWFRRPTIKTVSVRSKKVDAAPPNSKQVRNFLAAQNGRLFSTWNTQPQTADETLKTSLRALRARSREQANNNDYAQRFLGLVESNVVGPNGFTLQSQPKDPDGSIDKLASDAIESSWKDWGKKKHADLGQRLSFHSMQKLFIRTVAQDGEFCAIHTRGDKYGYALQIIDPETLDVDYNAELKSGRFIRMGIEFNASSQVAAYHFLTDSGDGYLREGKKYKRVAAANVIHSFIPQLVGQKRGIPWMSTALTRMNMLQGYEDASITNARAGASKMGFITTPAGETYTGDDQQDDGSVISDFEAGIIETLPEGYDFKSFDPGYPAGEFAMFMKACLRGISSGLNIPYPSLANDLEGISFSSIRAGELEARELWKTIQKFMIDDFLVPVFERWLLSALTVQAIKVNSRPLRLDRIEKYENAHFQGRRWDWVDPLKDISALEKEYQMNAISLSQIIRDKGRDPETTWNEKAKENETLKSLGLTPQQIFEAFNQAIPEE